MKPDYVSKRTTSFPILGFLVLLFILQCSLVLAETPEGHIPESPASLAPNAEETESESESVPPATTITEASPDAKTTSELQPTSEEPLPPVPTKPEAEDTGRLRRHLDFFGMNLGAEYLTHFYEEGNQSVPFIKLDIQLFNFRMNKLYFTIVEVYSAYLVGIAGAGTRIGYRLPLRSDWRSELRFGMGLGGGMLIPIFGGEAVHAFRMEPNMEYVYSTRYGSVGIGVEIPVFFHRAQIIDPKDTKYEHLRSTSIAAGVYFHFSVGRIELKHREREDLDIMGKDQESGMNP